MSQEAPPVRKNARGSVTRAFEIAVERIQKIDKQFCGEELLCDVNKALGAVKRNLSWV